MRQTKNFNISVPELGDTPDITQVSDAIQSLEDAIAGTLEVMNASIQGNKVALTSGSRATKRTKYYEGMAIKFVAPIQINPNTITLVSVDGLSDQVAEIPFLVNAGDSVDIIYKGNKFVATITAIQRSNSVTSTSTTTVATSQAVKTAYDKAMDAFNYAKLLCPYRVGDILTSVNVSSPAETWPGTEWGL
ncbi:MAG: tail fiber protein, partial [Paraclostridium sp.]